MPIILHYCTSSHYLYADAICELIEKAAKQRGTGIAKREPEYIKTKMDNGNAVIALDRSDDGFDCGVDRIARLCAGQTGLVADGFGEIRLVHRVPPV